MRGGVSATVNGVPSDRRRCSRVRRRLRDEAREPRYIKTVRSEGYVFAAAVEAVQAL